METKGEGRDPVQVLSGRCQQTDTLERGIVGLQTGGVSGADMNGRVVRPTAMADEPLGAVASLVDLVTARSQR